ncbi:MAG: hypothetical protein K9N51_03205 [Candidatus Pacebacteria bacterium]|nr:hypothetical protein [Candidatus Paceibacterota bacterium]
MQPIEKETAKEYLKNAKKLVETLFERRQQFHMLCPQLCADEEDRRELLHTVAELNNRIEGHCTRLEAMELNEFGVSALLKMMPVPVPTRCAVTLLLAARFHTFNRELYRVSDIVTYAAGRDPFVMWELRQTFKAGGTLHDLCEFHDGHSPHNRDNLEVALKEEVAERLLQSR